MKPIPDETLSVGGYRQWQGRLDALDGLRWFASLQVVFSHQAKFVPYLLWGSIWTQLFFLLSGFILAYSEMVKLPSKVPLTCWEYTWRRLRKIYPPYLLTLLISMCQTSHTAFEWKILVLNVFLLQAWVPLVDESDPNNLMASTTSWVGVAWFLSALLLYWQFLRPAARLAQRMSMKQALLVLLFLWLWCAVMFLIWMKVEIVSGYFKMVILHEGPLGYMHVFLSGVVLARIFVLILYVDADTGEAPQVETERLSLRGNDPEEALRLPCSTFCKWGFTITVIFYGSCMTLIPVVYDSPSLAVAHNGGILPILCFLLLTCGLETDLFAPVLSSSVAKVLGRISYCQYIIQGNVERLMFEHLKSNFWTFLPLYLAILILTAYLMEWMVSAVQEWLAQESLGQAAPMILSESTEESSSEDHRSVTDLWVCGL